MAKVVRGGNIFFKDDIKIIDAEVDCSLNLPSPSPIFFRDELQIFYNRHIFVALKNPEKDKQIKVYTMVFGLQETESPKAQEDKYFSDNAGLIKKLKEEFIEKVINGISVLDGSIILEGAFKQQLDSELIKKIKERYASKITQKSNPLAYVGKGLITKLDDDSVFNSEITGCERVLLLENKVYDLVTIPEFVSIFEKSFESSFYESFQKACKSGTPEEISKMLSDNKDKVHRKALPMVRNKIWHSDRSFKLFLDGTYWIPEFREEASNLVKLYQKLLEKKVKIDAVGEYLK